MILRTLCENIYSIRSNCKNEFLSLNNVNNRLLIPTLLRDIHVQRNQIFRTYFTTPIHSGKNKLIKKKIKTKASIIKTLNAIKKNLEQKRYELEKAKKESEETSTESNQNKPKSFVNIVNPPSFTLTTDSIPIESEDEYEKKSWTLSAKEEKYYKELTPISSQDKVNKANAREEYIEHEDTLSDETHCLGCGSKYQTTDPHSIGYIDQAILDRYIDEKRKYENKISNTIITNEIGDELVLTDELLEIEKEIMGEVVDSEEIVQPPKRIVCLRCFTLTRYNKVLPIYIHPSVYSETLRGIKDKKALIVKVVDILDFHGSMVGTIRKFCGNNPIIIAATKVDLLPHGAHLPRIKEWVRRELKKFGIKPVHVELISGETGYGVKQLADQIEWKRQNCDVYVVGSANVGKSTFINRLIDYFHGPEDKKLTVSRIPGTTLNLISLPIGKKSYLYDTPGLVSSKQIYQYLNSKELKAVIPKKRLKPAVYRIGPGKTLFIGGLARIDYLEGHGLVYFTVFTSNELYVHKTSTSKASELYLRKVGTMLTPPYKESLSTWEELTDYGEFVLENPDGDWTKAHADIVLPGLGWVSVTQKGTIKVKVWYPFGCAVGIREPLMPFESIKGTKPNPRANIKPVHL